MSIVNFDILNPVISNKRPFYNKKKGLFYMPLQKKYTYYVECSLYDPKKDDIDYYILLGNNKFDDNCRKCITDMYGRCRINVRGKLKDYIIEESDVRGNIDVEYIESKSEYDIFRII